MGGPIELLFGDTQILNKHTSRLRGQGAFYLMMGSCQLVEQKRWRVHCEGMLIQTKTYYFTSSLHKEACVFSIAGSSIG